jgi:hypothetical protein
VRVERGTSHSRRSAIASTSVGGAWNITPSSLPRSYTYVSICECGWSVEHHSLVNPLSLPRSYASVEHHTLVNSAFAASLICTRLFQVLKSVVAQWTSDIGTGQEACSEWAELLLNNVYHCVSSPQSKTYDPALHRLVHLMMQKVFLQLLHELKKLGSRIVFASFNQIIIATNKKVCSPLPTYELFLKIRARSHIHTSVPCLDLLCCDCVRCS